MPLQNTRSIIFVSATFLVYNENTLTYNVHIYAKLEEKPQNSFY